eukprot:7381090-Prymnesium_polylepis.2
MQHPDISQAACARGCAVLKPAKERRLRRHVQEAANFACAGRCKWEHVQRGGAEGASATSRASSGSNDVASAKWFERFEWWAEGDDVASATKFERWAEGYDVAVIIGEARDDDDLCFEEDGRGEQGRLIAPRDACRGREAAAGHATTPVCPLRKGDGGVPACIGGPLRCGMS